MTMTINLGQQRAIDLDPIIHKLGKPSILLSLTGEVNGKVHNCILIPVEKVDQLVQTLQLVANLARQNVAQM